jgi:hypothetical protein
MKYGLYGVMDTGENLKVVRIDVLLPNIDVIPACKFATWAKFAARMRQRKIRTW